MAQEGQPEKAQLPASQPRAPARRLPGG
jgi:hypothetical protein